MPERVPRPQPSRPPAKPLYRLIVDTAQSGASVSERRPPPAEYGIESRETVVGRDFAADIRLDEDFVSRRHAVFLLRDHELHLEDLGSTNGTRVNGDLVESRIQVRPGDILEFGGSLCRVVPGIEAPAEPFEEDEDGFDEADPGEEEAAPSRRARVGPIAGEPLRTRLLALAAVTLAIVAIVLLVRVLA